MFHQEHGHLLHNDQRLTTMTPQHNDDGSDAGFGVLLYNTYDTLPGCRVQLQIAVVVAVDTGNRPSASAIVVAMTVSAKGRWSGDA